MNAECGIGKRTMRPESDSTPREFWAVGAKFDAIEVTVEPAEKSLELLGRLGPSPFERGGFPVIGFLATTYDKVSRFAAERK